MASANVNDDLQGSDESPTTVFVLDDEPKVLSAISETLSSRGWAVKAYQSPSECLKALKEEACDLLVSDVNMPEMDGIRFLRQTREVRPLLPVLLISGYGDIPMAVRAVKAGAADFLEKPVTEESLLSTVDHLLSLSGAGGNIDASLLTPAEKRILLLVAEGRTNKDIAQLLNRSLRTVENHRHRLMQKLRADSVADLVKIALAMGAGATIPAPRS